MTSPAYGRGRERSEWVVPSPSKIHALNFANCRICVLPANGRGYSDLDAFARRLSRMTRAP